MNPGAPEFTPRTLRATKPIPASPIHNSWAEDVEDDEVDLPQKTPMEDNNSGLEWEAHPDYTRAPPNTAAASPDSLNVTIEATATGLGEHRPRRNTLQSVSCPDPPLLPLQCSPSRCVSQPDQPVPSSRVPRPPTPIENLAPETPSDVQVQLNVKPDAPKSATAEGKFPRETNRGRGSRGRGHRGRYRGKGRCNASDPKQNKSRRTTNAPQPPSNPVSHA